MVIERIREIKTRSRERLQRILTPLRSRHAEAPATLEPIITPLSPEDERRVQRGNLVSTENPSATQRKEQEVRVELAAQNTSGSENYSSQSTPDVTPPSGAMYRFYTQLKERREHPQSTGKLVLDVAAETLGYPLILIPGMQWLALIPWGPEYTTGDALNIGEAVLGRTLGGKKLTPFERLLYVAGGLAPIIPGRVVVGLWETLEDKLVFPALERRYAGKPTPQPPRLS